MKKERLDILVHRRGLTVSREKARAEIMSGNIIADGVVRDKPGMAVSADADISLKNTPPPFVSRGGLKLEKAIHSFKIDPSGFICADCGASTGGFTDCLLKHGAKKIYAVDVGYGQLAWNLRNDERVVNMERFNIRYVTKNDIPDDIDLAAADLSFISLKLVLPAIQTLLKPDGAIICLIKPQFEAGRGKVGKKGVVRDGNVHIEVVTDIMDFARSLGFTPLGLDFSPVTGPEGNIEYLAYFTLADSGGAPDFTDNALIEDVVRQSHAAFDR